MSRAKETRTKITSIKNTQKITRAMEMVAASKMRKAQLRMQKSKAYALKIRQVIAHVATAHPEYQHVFLKSREVRRAGYIVVTSDRGLCGGLNLNVFKVVLRDMKKLADKNIDVDLCVIGKKGEAFFNRIGGHVVAQANQLGDAPRVMDLVGVVKIMLDSFSQGHIDVLYIAYNDYVNTMVQRPQLFQLVPVVPPADEAKTVGYWDYLYEPDNAKVLLNTLLTRYIESQVYQAVIENLACEQAARMVAMKNATENAGKLISELKLIYNKARQAAITNEVCEIVSGADAV